MRTKKIYHKLKKYKNSDFNLNQNEIEIQEWLKEKQF